MIPQYVKNVLLSLNNNGFEAYAVGGCVRDCLMDKIPNDYDVTTNATPDEMLCTFKSFKVIPTGLKHGTVTVVSDGENIEVTTYRIDGEYVDNRHPQNVTFTANLKDDLKRRDFTVNAMAMDIDGNILDFYGGKEDLKNKVIKCVGNPDTRFEEDGLRIVRCIRFASTLGFTIEEQTKKSVHSKKHLLSNISKERLAIEFSKLICGKGACEIMTEFCDVILQFVKWINSDNFEKLKCAPDNLYIRLALCFDNSASAVDALNDLKFDNYTKKQVKELVDAKLLSKADEYSIKKHLSKYGADSFNLHISYQQTKYGETLENTKKLFEKIIQNKECYNISMLDIKGDEIIALGAKGKQTGEILNTLLDEVMSGKIKNENKILIKKAKELVK